MKRFIKWLANVSGVIDQIRKEERENIGDRMIQDSYWWNGGITYNRPMWNLINFSVLYGEALRQNTFLDISSLRDTIYKMDYQKLNVYDDREVYGYWSDTEKPHFIPKEEYNGEKGYEPRLRIMYK